MKITRHTPDQLILDHTPWMFGILFGVIILASTICIAILPFNGYPEGFFAVPFLIVGTLLFKGFVRRDQVIFDRTSGTVTLRHRTLTSYRSDTIDLADVESAELDVKQHRQSGGNGTIDVYCPALRVDGTLRPLRNLYSNLGRHRETVDTINQWLSA